MVREVTPADAFWRMAEKFIAEGENGPPPEAPFAPDVQVEKKKIWDLPLLRVLPIMAKNFAGNLHEVWQLRKRKDKNLGRDLMTVASAAISEIPVVGQIFGLTMMVGGTAMMGVKELVKMAKLKEESKEDGYWSRSALVQAGKAMWGVVRGRGKEAAFGKREKGQGELEDLQLTNEEAALAGLIGGTASAISILLLSDLSILSVIPGMKAVRRLSTPLLTMLIAGSFTSLGAAYFEGAQEKREQFVDLCLRVNSPVMQLITLGTLAKGAGQEFKVLNERWQAVNQANQPEVAQTPPPPPLTKTATWTQSPTVAELQSSLTPVLPSETNTPAPDINWQPGQEITPQVLEASAANHHGWGLDTDNNPATTEIQVFYLDNNQTPDYVTISGNHLINDNGNFFNDINHNGVIDSGERTSFWTWSSLLKVDQRLDGLDIAEPQPGGDFIPIEKEGISGLQPIKVHAAPISLEAQAEGLPPPTGYDFNNDGVPDILTNENGQLFADLDHQDGDFNPNVDELVDEVRLTGNNEIAAIKYADGSSWVRQADGTMIGTLSDGRTLDIHSDGKLSILQKELHELNLAWSPQRIGAEAFRNQNLSAAEIQPRVNVPHQGTVTWEQLIKDERGGQVGVIQGQLWNEGSPNLSAQQAGAAAYIAVVNDHPTGPEMIADVNSSMARFSLENTFGEIIKSHTVISGSPQQWAWAAMRNDNANWTFSSDNIYRGPINKESLSIFTNYNYTDWEQWLRDNDYIN